jgi:uncharacterized integral membrane protein
VGGGGRVSSTNGGQKMITSTIVLIVIGVLMIFSVQNATPVVISFLIWKFEASLAIVLFLSILAGAFIGVITAYRFRMKSLKKEQISIDPKKVER